MSFPPPPPPGGSFPPPAGATGSPDPMGRPLAEQWERIVSGLIDAVIIGVVANIISRLFIDNLVLSIFPGFIIGTLYFGLMDSAMTQGRTVGKMVLGMATVDATTGQPLETGPSFVRGVVKGGLWYLTCCIGAIAEVVFLFTDSNRQTLHDKVGKTLVVKTK